MSVTFEQGTCGLIGPNGAGKTTFFNVLSGFVRPAAGTVRAFGDDLLSMAHYRRARWGVRRTFQTEQAIEELSVFDNVAMVHEHSRPSGALPPRGRAGRDRRSPASTPTRTPRCARSGPASAAWSRWPAPSSGGRGWCCWTSPPPGCRTRRPSTWPR